MILFLIITFISSSLSYEINKCCPDGQMYSNDSYAFICVPVDNLSSKYYWIPENVNETIFDNLKINFNKPSCVKDESIWSTSYSLNINESSVFLEDDKAFENSSFCLEKVYFNETGPTIIAMKYECKKKISILKCCDNRYNLDDNRKCKDSRNSIDWKLNSTQESMIRTYRLLHGFPKCGRKHTKYADKYNLNSDGSISLKEIRIVNWDEYCVDYMLGSDNILVEKIIVCYDNDTISGIECKKKLCIYKCCDSGKYLDNTGSCKDSGNAPDWKLNSSQETILGVYKMRHGFPDCNWKYTEYTDEYELNNNGNISLNMNRVVDRNKYCVDYILRNDNVLVEKIIMCLEKIETEYKCENGPCILKCCYNGHNLDDDGICKDSGNSIDWKLNSLQEAAIEKYRMLHGFPKCGWEYTEYADEYNLNSDGSISLVEENRVVNWDEYCVDYMLGSDNVLMEKIIVCYDNDTILSFECEKKHCIFKCCDSGKYLDNTGSCKDSGNVSDWKFNTSREAILGEYEIWPRFPMCGRENTEYANKYDLNSDGSISLTSPKRIINWDNYCGDYTLGSDNILVEKIIVCTNDPFMIFGIVELLKAFLYLITVCIIFWIPVTGGSLRWPMPVQMMCHLINHAGNAYYYLTIRITIKYTSCVIIGKDFLDYTINYSQIR